MLTHVSIGILIKLCWLQMEHEVWFWSYFLHTRSKPTNSVKQSGLEHISLGYLYVNVPKVTGLLVIKELGIPPLVTKNTMTSQEADYISYITFRTNLAICLEVNFEV